LEEEMGLLDDIIDPTEARSTSSWPEIFETVLPLNPELYFSEPESRKTPNGARDWSDTAPILPANPFASLLLDQDDDFAPLPFAFLLAPEHSPYTPTAISMTLPAICSSTDIRLLQRIVFAPVTEKLGARCTSKEALHMWRTTCGGDTFMGLGMLTYWKDEVESPKRLRALKKGKQRKFSPEEDKQFAKLLREEIEQDIVKEIPESQVAYSSPVGIVPKKGGEWRKIWDGRVVNDEQVAIHFRMEGVETVQRLMRIGDWATSIDLKSAFNHLRVHPSMRPFLAFEYKGRFYQYMAMPFGSKHSPRLFTEALSYPMRFIRSHWDIRVVQYMDDLLLLHQDREKLELYTLQIAAYLQCLGWTLSIKKCAFTPTQTVVFLGWLWDSRSLTMMMTAEMRQAMLQKVRDWLTYAVKNAVVTSKALGGLIGSLNFLRGQFPRASLYLRTLHSALTEMVRLVDWTGSSYLTPAICSELLFWSRSIRLNTPFCFAPRTSQALLTTDASEGEWGAHIEIGSLLYLSNGLFFPKDSLTSSNQRETAAVLRALTSFQGLLQENRIRALSIRSDNSVTVYNLQRQGAGLALLGLTRAIFSLLAKLDIRIEVRHIPGIENVLADQLSRMEASGDYSLRQELFQLGCKRLQVTPTIDLFAHCQNRKCQRFAALDSPLQSGRVFADAFSQRWDNEISYVFPPVQIIPRVLQKIRNENATTIVVIPKWTTKPWWGMIKPMMKSVLELGSAKHILIPGPSMTNSKSKKELPPGLFLMALLTPPW
jgi:hypothetical protein